MFDFFNPRIPKPDGDPLQAGTSNWRKLTVFEKIVKKYLKLLLAEMSRGWSQRNRNSNKRGSGNGFANREVRQRVDCFKCGAMGYWMRDC